MTLALLCLYFLCSSAPPASLQVSATPAYVVLHADTPQNVTITTDVRDSAGQPVRNAALLSDATAGTVEPFHEVAPGRYQARMERPSQNFPQAGVVTVFVAPANPNTPPLVGTTVVQFAAEFDLKGHTEPGATMKVDVAGHIFGPVTADGTGHFALPVIVPPGAGTARGTSTDTLGNASTSTINLYLPALDRLHTFVYPRLPTADGHSPAWIFVTTLSASGAPQKGALTYTGARGKLGTPESLAPGLWRVPYTPPTRVAPGFDRVHFSAPLEADEPIALAPGPPARLALSVQPAALPADGIGTAVATLTVADAHDNPTDADAPHITVDGTALDANHVAVGVYVSTVPSRTRIGMAQVQATAAGLSADPAPLTWHIPTPVILVLQVLQQRADGWVLRVDTQGNAQVANRLTLQASRGSLTRQPDGTWWLARTPQTESVDVVARDAQTGVSAWLRVPVVPP